MKSPHTRTDFFAAHVLLLALCSAASGQTTNNGPPPAPGHVVINVPQHTVEWREFKSEAGGFSLKFPGVPRVEHVSFNKGPVELMRHTHTASVGGDVQFEVDYVDMPAGFNDPDLSLEGGISGLTHALEAQGARVLTKEKVVRGSCEGRDTTLFLPHPPRRGGFAQGRAFGSGQRYYFLMFVGEEDGP